MEKENGFCPTGMTAADYLDICERVLDAYGAEYLEAQLALPDEIYLATAYRTSCMLAILLSAGRRAELYGLWLRVTDKAHRCFAQSRRSSYNDLTLKELLLARVLMRERTPPEYAAVWDEALSGYDFDTHYAEHEGGYNNMAIYGLVGAYLMERLGFADSAEQFDRVMPWVLERLDENGMFDDVDDALLYDLSARVQLEELLWLGYDGRYAREIEEKLTRAAELSLRMQSAAYQIPYGGRSNQYLHNEALFASMCEFEAQRRLRAGDMELAGQFRRAAHLSVTTVFRYLNAPGGPKHVKNLFEQDSLFGLDNYGTFPRYMHCLAIFLNYGLQCALMPEGPFRTARRGADIPERPAPCETGGFVCRTSERFRKIFAACGGYSLELATDADPHYDAPGLGRLHRTGVPGELGLSVPFARTPGYLLTRMRIPFDRLGPEPVSVYIKAHPEAGEELERQKLPTESLAVCTGWTAGDGEPRYLCRHIGCLRAELGILREDSEEVRFTLRWTGTEGVDAVEETYTLTAEGLTLRARVPGARVRFRVPLLEDNGRERTRLAQSGDAVCVELGGHRYTARVPGARVILGGLAANRSGLYRVADLCTEREEAVLHLTLG